MSKDRNLTPVQEVVCPIVFDDKQYVAELELFSKTISKKENEILSLKQQMLMIHREDIQIPNDKLHDK